ncbi:MAG: AbrB/MazE/SpoVT family DNA-binding domain-containing protein [Chlamydiae bacterium]|nr:AbrB/MazE/SpoVT family DNA-binding domain-containing protein [Chlamydiota bacterium]MBI3266565.1 AbrB/MazE/SpoVT family DNA-binding domain-containing protein [Chlamydiota bacterium]
MITAIVTSKGQIVIPSKIRQHMSIKRGTKLYIEEKGDELILRPVTPRYFEKIAGVLSTKGKLTKLLLEERAKDRKKEA